MFYEEQIIDGVLHYRSTPTGEWVPMSAERLTALLIEARRHGASPFQVIPPVVFPLPVSPGVPPYNPNNPNWYVVSGPNTSGTGNA